MKTHVRVRLAILICVAAAFAGFAWSASANGLSDKAPTGFWGE